MSELLNQFSQFSKFTLFPMPRGEPNEFARLSCQVLLRRLPMPDYKRLVRLATRAEVKRCFEAHFENFFASPDIPNAVCAYYDIAYYRTHHDDAVREWKPNVELLRLLLDEGGLPLSPQERIAMEPILPPELKAKREEPEEKIKVKAKVVTLVKDKADKASLKKKGTRIEVAPAKVVLAKKVSKKKDAPIKKKRKKKLADAKLLQVEIIDEKRKRRKLTRPPAGFD